MRIISFALTTSALQARRKSVTRREWKDKSAQQWINALETAKAKGEKGLLVQAWDKSPRFKGKRIGTVLVTSITKEPTRTIPDEDWEAEGFAYMADHGLSVGPNLSCEQLWRAWRQHPTLETYVIRFEIVDVLPLEENEL